MIRMFCDAHHERADEGLCPVCEELLCYAQERLRRCPFGENKGACSKCEIHCYKPEMRSRMMKVMCYCGPRMIARHPLLAIHHLLKTRASRAKAKTRNKHTC
jgi:hypothetical protein